MMNHNFPGWGEKTQNPVTLLADGAPKMLSNTPGFCFSGEEIRFKCQGRN